MPFINSKISVTITDEQEQEIEDSAEGIPEPQ